MPNNRIIKTDEQIDQECRFLEDIAQTISKHYNIDEFDALILGLDLLDKLERIELR